MHKTPDSKPYIVVNLNLEKDLDFRGEIIASSWVGYTGSVTTTEVKKDIELHAATNINYNGDKKLNPTETANGIEDFKRQLTPAYPNGDYEEYYGNSLDIKAVRSLAMEERLKTKGNLWKSSTEYEEENNDIYGFYRFDKYFTGEDFSKVNSPCKIR